MNEYTGNNNFYFILFPVLINSIRDGLCFLTPNIQQLYAS
ncbi:hypothetical protein ECP030526011_0134 [Escherichia coli P0305260.11]|nr:hypothetical protein ECSTECEH250_0181 [Escherichia coli STEC_EH250]EHV64086.1 hypothetical protein ECDEC6A_0125 [Escherichia coli DEC6A]EHV67414.1 hypothetical protein ECDEC6C_0121 [Escherichia coli DEC6C]EHV80422.1 hypothetical protein ECDEC6E_0096 [Escherichia coli DEC6E]EII45245.1 hypothetical protein EC23916_0147 [Escherichia coli 2.3916]EKI26159.1 hypothetical protein ECTW15901_0132 [Escherichia coli TW15901]EKK49826.1 hypothetical protein EC80566_0130 [Escherichia coli 8.0566]EKK716